MIEVKDRSVQYPNRYQLQAVVGASNTYDLTAVPGTVAAAGTPVNKALLDQYLAASGTTAGTASALTLVQDGFGLFDGACIRAKLHVAVSGSAVTLNINGTGAKSLVRPDGRAPYLLAGSYLVAAYNSATEEYICLAADTPYVAGTYTGDDAAERTITLGFQPYCVLIQKLTTATSNSVSTTDISFMALQGQDALCGTSGYKVLTPIATGFKVYKNGTGYSSNTSGHIWDYIAFR